MKKKILSGVFALAVLVATGYGVNQSMKSDAGLSDLALSNVEALARNENGDDKARDRIDYIRTYDTAISGVSFRCTAIGVLCDGTGSIECLQWETTECERI